MFLVHEADELKTVLNVYMAEGRQTDTQTSLILKSSLLRYKAVVLKGTNCVKLRSRSTKSIYKRVRARGIWET